MSYFRATWRALLIVALTLLSATILVLTAPFKLVAPAWQLRARNWVFRTWGRNFCRITGMRLEIRGPIPEGSFFLISNHSSYMDIPLLGSAVDAAFVGKADLRKWPLLGQIFGIADTIFIDRGKKRDLVRVMEQIGRNRERGLGALVFPEGTSGSGEEILRFKPSLLQFAAERDLPVHWAVISYRTPPGWPPARDIVCWWGNTPLFPHFPRFLRLPYYEAVLEFGEATHHHPDRKILAEKLHGAMAERFTSSV